MLERAEVSPDEFYRRLSENTRLPTTTEPSCKDFEKLDQQAISPRESKAIGALLEPFDYKISLVVRKFDYKSASNFSLDSFARLQRFYVLFCPLHLAEIKVITLIHKERQSPVVSEKILANKISPRSL